MKFRFCGDGDCPDWVLGEIISTLSVMTSENVEVLAEIVAKKFCGVEEFDEVIIKSLVSPVSEDGKSAIACIHFLLTNAVCYSADAMVFSEEVQQLGLPSKHTEGMCRVLNKYYTGIRQILKDKEFIINELTSVKVLPSSSNTINCTTFEFKISQELVDGIPQDTTHVLNIDNTQLKVLLDELMLARGIMEKYNENSDDEEDKTEEGNV